MTTTHASNNVHSVIDALCRQAKRLAPKAAEEALDSCNTNLRPAGPRQAKAWDLVLLAHRLNSWSDVTTDATEAAALVAEHGWRPCS